MTIKETIEEHIAFITDHPITITEQDLRAAFRDIVEETIKEMSKPTKLTRGDEMEMGAAVLRGYRLKEREEKATGENIIKSLE